MRMTPADLLEQWLNARLGKTALAWLRNRIDAARKGSRQDLLKAFNGVARRIARSPLALDPREQAIASATRTNWRPGGWTLDQGARALLVLRFPADDDLAYTQAVEELFADADLREQVALLRMLPLLPYPAAYHDLAREAVRSNLTPLLEALIFDNPYPFEQFDERQWNVTILKCLFLDLPLERVIGLEERNNRELGRMVRSLVSERHAAGRPLPEAAYRWMPRPGPYNRPPAR